jgi:hypothetical protein
MSIKSGGVGWRGGGSKSDSKAFGRPLCSRPKAKTSFYATDMFTVGKFWERTIFDKLNWGV